MRWIVRIFVALVVVVAAAAGAAFLLPRHVLVERTAVIAAAPDKIFPLVNDLKAAAAWSPWVQQAGPDLKTTYDGPPDGVGQTMRWSSAKMGDGSQTISASALDRSVTSTLDFGPNGTAVAGFALAPQGGSSTEVVWTLDADMGNNPVGRYFGLLMGDMIGAQYEQGLANLKALAERAAPPQVTRTTVP